MSPERLNEAMFKSEDDLPDNLFKYLANWNTKINASQLKTEYILFSKSFGELIEGLTFPNYPEYCNKQIINDSSTENESSIDEEESKYEITSLNIINVLSSHDLKTAFPNLYLAYKCLGTIPASSASAERSFSKVL